MENQQRFSFNHSFDYEENSSAAAQAARRLVSEHEIQSGRLAALKIEKVISVARPQIKQACGKACIEDDATASRGNKGSVSFTGCHAVK